MSRALRPKALIDWQSSLPALGLCWSCRPAKVRGSPELHVTSTSLEKYVYFSRRPSIVTQTLQAEIEKCEETAKAQELLVSDIRMQLGAVRKDASRNLQSQNKSQAIIKQVPHCYVPTSELLSSTLSLSGVACGTNTLIGH